MIYDLYTIFKTSVRLIKYPIKSMFMNTPNQSNNTHPVIQVVKNFINKLRQNPEVYPIKYYKKGQRFRRNWKSPMVK